MLTEKEMNVVDMMHARGGSFVKALAECFYRADMLNVIKLKQAFPEYWKEYEEMAEKNEQEGL